MRRVLLVVSLLLVGTVLPVFGQQTEVNRIDIFTGYSFLRTSSIGLNQHGFNGSFGVNVNRWLGMGADFGIYKGSVKLAVKDTKLPGILAAQATTPAQAAFLAAIAGAAVDTDTTTYTFAAGPQLNYRHFNKLTLFVRPGLGMFHHVANLNATQLTTLATGLALNGFTVTGLAPSLSDTVAFYGVGGGFDADFSKHFGMRFSVDLVHANPFKSLLRPQNELRISIGPRFRFKEVKM